MSIEPEATESLPTLRELWQKVLERRGALIASILVTGAALWLLHRGALPVLPPSDALRTVSPLVILSYFGLFALSQSLKAYRWRYLVRPIARLSDGEIVAANFVFFAALLVIPLRLGELVRPVLLRRKSRLTGWQVLGLSGAERIVDGLFASALVLWALQLSNTPVRTDLTGPAALVRPTALTMATVFAVGLSGVVVFFTFRSWTRRVIRSVVGLVSKARADFVADKVENIADGLRFLEHPREAVPFIIATAGYWGSMVAGALVLLRGCGLDFATLAHAGSLCGVLALGLLVPGAPGFFGTFQLSAYAGLTVFVASDALAHQGALVVFFMYVIQVVWVLGVGAVCLPGSLRRARRTAPARAA